MDFQSEPVVVTATPGGLRVAIRGPVHTNTAWLDDELNKVVAAKPKHVDLDLGAMNYVSSVGLGSLVALRNRITTAGGTLRVVAIQSQVLGVFKYAYLDKVFQIEPGVVLAKPTS